jgi:hypothetical protein
VLVRPPKLVSLLTTAVLFGPVLAACAGDDDGDQVSDEEWVASFCQATARLNEAIPPVTPGSEGQTVTPEWLRSVAPLYRQYGSDLEEIGPPAGLEDFFDAFVDATYETADLLAKGDPGVDAFRPLEQVQTPESGAERFGPLSRKDPACQRMNITFDYVPHGAETNGPTPRGAAFELPKLDYGHPEKLLQPGPQSTLSAASIDVRRREVMPAVKRRTVRTPTSVDRPRGPGAEAARTRAT